MENYKINIVHVLAGKANPNTLNGVNKIVHNLATEQFIKGLDVTVCGIANNVNNNHHHKYPLILFLKSPFKIFPPFKFLFYLNTLKNKNIVFHFHSSFIPWYIFTFIYIKIFKMGKIVFTPHGQYAEPKLKGSFLKKIYFIFFESIILKLSDRVQIGGKNEINGFTKKYILNKSQLIPNGYDGVVNDLSRLNEKKDFVFGYLGRLDSKQKGLDLLFQGFSLYKQNGGIGVLKLVGLGEDKKDLELMAKSLKIEQSIEFLGALFDDDKKTFYKSISVFVHTSRWEGFPMSCLEAASFGVPLLITDATNMGDLVTKYDCGYVIYNNTVSNIRKALNYFNQQSKQDLYSKSEGAYKMINEELNWKNISNLIVEKLYLM